jgi:hypothetical protein
MLQFHKEQDSPSDSGEDRRLMADCVFHSLADDIGLFGRLVRLHSLDQEVSKPADEYVSKQDGRELRNFNRAKVRLNNGKGQQCLMILIWLIKFCQGLNTEHVHVCFIIFITNTLF